MASLMKTGIATLVIVLGALASAPASAEAITVGVTKNTLWAVASTAPLATAATVAAPCGSEAVT